MKKGLCLCAIVYAIELSTYLSWLKGKGQLCVVQKIYDVFIAYKRNTAGDFALFLKSCLTDEGFRAFYDRTEIPKEIKGTEKWFEFRDKAIINSRRFLVILTISIESSREVAKELFQARKIPDMKFIFMRHKEIDEDIKIEYKGKTINLLEYNQVSFQTPEDLARKVLKILFQPMIEKK